MLSSRFIPQFVFYTQSVVRSLQSMFYTDRKRTILDRVNQHERYLFRRQERRRAFTSKHEQDLSRLGFVQLVYIGCSEIQQGSGATFKF